LRQNVLHQIGAILRVPGVGIGDLEDDAAMWLQQPRELVLGICL